MSMALSSLTPALLVCRTTRFDKDDVPDLSRLGRKSLSDSYRSEPYSSKSDAYGGRGETYGRDSHREGSSTDNNSFSAVRERVQMGIATSHSHTEMLEDMVLNLSEGGSRRDVDNDKSILKDLVKEMVTFRYLYTTVHKPQYVYHSTYTTVRTG